MSNEKKQLKLSPDSFTINENGEVLINNSELAKALKENTENAPVGEHGIWIAVGT